MISALPQLALEVSDGPQHGETSPRDTVDTKNQHDPVVKAPCRDFLWTFGLNVCDICRFKARGMHLNLGNCAAMIDFAGFWPLWVDGVDVWSIKSQSQNLESRTSRKGFLVDIPNRGCF